MYKLTFDDKPEANTYIKWASQKGYKVEGPFREKLAKNAKKFDLNGKPKKYGYVVIRKRGGGPGMGGAMPDDDTKPGVNKVRIDSEGRSVYVDNDVYFALAKKYKVHEIARMSSKERRAKAGISSGSISKASSTKHESGAGGGSSKGTISMGEALRKASKQGGGKELKESQTLLWWGKASSEEKKNLAQDAGYKGALGLKLAVELSPEQVERLTEIRGKKGAADEAEGKPVTVEPAYAELPVSKAAKKSDKPPKKKGAVDVAEKPPEQRTFAPGTFAMPETLRQTQYRSSPERSPERISKAAGAAGIRLTPEQIKASQRKVKGVIEEKVEKIAGETSRKPTDAEQVAADWEARGYTPEQIAASQKAFAKSEKELRDYYKETKLTEARRRPEGKKILGKTFVEAMAAEAVATEPETIEGKYWEETKLTKAQKEGKSWTGAMAREGRKVHEAAEKEGDRQTSARKKLEKKLKKEGIDPAKRLAGISDYTKELEKYEGAKIEAIGKGKVAKAKATAEREKKYEKTFASYEEAAKWGKGQREVSKEEDIKEMRERSEAIGKVLTDKTLTPKEKSAEVGRLGKEFEEVAKAKQARGGVGAKRKSYVVRTKKGFKVITGTKEELETPTSLKAALAKEKRKFKKRKKLLEKPLREIKRAKKVLRTSSRHIARQILRKPSSLVPTRGKHPAIGNVSMEYHRARIATPILVPKSIAGQYTTGEDTKRRR